MLIVTALPANALPTGVRRRLEHHLDALAPDAPAVRHLFESEQRSAASTIAEARAKVRGAFGDGIDEVLLIGLGSLGILVAAHEFARRGARVVFDQCDSAVSQTLAEVRDLRQVRPGTVAKTAARLVLLATLRHSVEITYISAADARRDRALIVGRRSRVVGPTAPGGLETLDAVDPRSIGRVVVPADFGSAHLRVGLTMLWEALRSGSPVPVDLYGPVPPDRAVLGLDVRFRGFAADLRDVYAGSTVVFVPNVGGAGIANKLVEAAAAGRPAIAHPSAIARLGAPVQGWLYRDERELRRVLERIAAGEPPSAL